MDVGRSRSDHRRTMRKELAELRAWAVTTNKKPAPAQLPTHNRIDSTIYAKCSNDQLTSFCIARQLCDSASLESARESKDSLAYRTYMTCMLMHADDNPKFERFLELPAELRNAIYELTTVHLIDQGAKLSPHEVPNVEAILPLGHTTWIKAKPVLAITRTCSQIRKEALPVFYTVNRFAISITQPRSKQTRMTAGLAAMQTADSWLEEVVGENVSAVRQLQFILSDGNCSGFCLFSIFLKFNEDGDAHVRADTADLECSNCVTYRLDMLAQIADLCAQSRAEDGTTRLTRGLMERIILLLSQ